MARGLFIALCEPGVHWQPSHVQSSWAVTVVLCHSAVSCCCRSCVFSRSSGRLPPTPYRQMNFTNVPNLMRKLSRTSIKCPEIF